MSLDLCYIVDGHKDRGTISSRLKSDDVYLSIGENFDQYRFFKHSYPGHDLVRQRLQQLRDQYSYLRLWYSGGLDSKLALDKSLEYGIHIDEVLITKRWGNPSYDKWHRDFSPQHEIEPMAIRTAQHISKSFPDIKVTVLDMSISEDYYCEVFQDLLWYDQTTDWFFDIASAMPAIFYKYINQRFNLIDEPKNRCDIVGGVTPDIWFDHACGKWKFAFVDSPFHNSFGADVENFLVTDSMPELIEYHVNSIIDNFLVTIKPAKFQQTIDQRDLKLYSDLYQNVRVNRQHQYPKKINLDLVKIPTDDFFWNLQGPKPFYNLINRYHCSPMPMSVKLYIENTDWEKIRSVVEKGRTCTKTWTLE